MHADAPVPDCELAGHRLIWPSQHPLANRQVAVGAVSGLNDKAEVFGVYQFGDRKSFKPRSHPAANASARVNGAPEHAIIGCSENKAAGASKW